MQKSCANKFYENVKQFSFIPSLTGGFLVSFMDKKRFSTLKTKGFLLYKFGINNCFAKQPIGRCEKSLILKQKE